MEELIKERARKVEGTILDLQRDLGRLSWATSRCGEPARRRRELWRASRLQGLVTELTGTIEDILVEARLALGEKIAWIHAGERWLLSATESDDGLLVTLTPESGSTPPVSVECIYVLASRIDFSGPPHWSLAYRSGDNSSTHLTSPTLVDGLRRALRSIDLEPPIPIVDQAVS